METGRQATLLLFKAGGSRFAVEAASVRRIAPGDWLPESSDQAEAGAQVVSLAEELGMLAALGDRILLVEADEGVWGFRVDSIDSEVLGDYQIHPVPQLLAGWMEPVVICGVADSSSGGELIHVLDLRLLAHHLQGRAEQVAKGKPG